MTDLGSATSVLDQKSGLGYRTSPSAIFLIFVVIPTFWCGSRGGSDVVPALDSLCILIPGHWLSRGRREKKTSTQKRTATGTPSRGIRLGF
ncbi:uncharacterized protein BT62DRAFT_934953 [Guyanagaster necrorhizus]|uniref:Uncharacterized protein n=1 Tax=Guyanagaster necrorhizus TaxID=856835 RepID=A0A9P7VN24_9AGAR|nr:uncharacterized protein BT62DRAFT_934953 [Guyanagaster necrorhizus MCA 3950]KAG7443340.1 hypothetical protein BT62DRAFT_934953 [Guyanagaster necrorhizus MCA 3950]